MANALDTRPPGEAAGDGTHTAEEPAVSSEELLDLLGDEYAREVLEAVSAEPMAGQEIAEETEISTPTVYRRLEKLERAGLVEAEMVFDDDGHHYQRYRPAVAGASFRFDRGGLTASVRTDDDTSRRRVAAER